MYKYSKKKKMRSLNKHRVAGTEPVSINRNGSSYDDF